MAFCLIHPEGIRNRKGNCTECAKARDKASKAAWSKRNVLALRAMRKAWTLANPEYQETYRAINKEKSNAYMRQWWALQHPSKRRAIRASRRATERNAKPAWFGELDRFIMDEAQVLAINRTQLFGFKWEVDHIIPLRGRTINGLHVWNNIQVIPMLANRKKANYYEALS